jgi:hypothetical protein
MVLFRSLPALVLLLASPWVLAKAPQATCHARDEAQVTALFDAWQADLQSGDAKALVGRYGTLAVLRTAPKGKALRTAKARQRYYTALQARHPTLELHARHVTLACNAVTDAGSYTLRFADGSTASERYRLTHEWNGQRWLIREHLLTPLPAAQ